MTEPNYKNIYKIGLKYTSEIRILEEKNKLNSQKIRDLKKDILDNHNKHKALRSKFDILFTKE